MKHIGRRALATALLLGAGIALGHTAAAFWSSSDASNPAAAAADAVGAGTQPTVSATGSSVAASWAPSTTNAGAAVTGYTVARYAAASGGTAAGGCAGTISALTCNESSVPDGTWYYGVTPKIALWAGAEGVRRSVFVDTTAPSGGSISYSNGYVTNTSVTVTFSAGTDGGSGINAATSQLQRAAAPFTNGSCGTFAAYVDAAPAGTASPYADSGVTDGNCYKWQYLVADTLGNTATYTSNNVTKIDTTGPVITVSSSGANVYATGLSVFFKTTGAGSFTVTASDPQSGIASASFPAAPLGWSVSGSGNSRTYTLGVATLSSSITVSATNNAATSSGNQSITQTPDIAAPSVTGGALAPVGNTTTQGFVKAGSQYYIYATATDGGAGMASVGVNASALTAGQTAVPLVAGSYSAFGTTYNYRSAALTADAGLTAGAKSYAGTATDNVGNVVTPGSGSATVDNTAPTGSITSPSNGFAAASTTVTASSADVTAGVFSATLQYSVHGAGTWNTIAVDTSAPYSATWDTTALVEGGTYDLRVVTEDNASNVFTSPIVAVVVDTTPPAVPSAPALAAASDTGVTGDNMTRLTTPTLTGTATTGVTVKLFDGVTQVASTTAAGGTYSVAASTLAAGAHTITATATDTAGNASTASAGTVITVDTSVPTPSDVTLANGGTSQRIDTGDTVSILYSEQLNASTFCSAWTSNSGTQTLSNVTVNIANGTTETLTLTTASCTFHLGSIVVANYVSATSSFTSSTVTWNPTTKIIQITMGTFTGSRNTGVIATAPKYTPDATLADLAGNTMAATQFTDPQSTGF
jgi:hypothetical protein